MQVRQIHPSQSSKFPRVLFTLGNPTRFREPHFVAALRASIVVACALRLLPGWKTSPGIRPGVRPAPPRLEVLYWKCTGTLPEHRHGLKNWNPTWKFRLASPRGKNESDRQSDYGIKKNGEGTDTRTSPAGVSKGQKRNEDTAPCGV